MLGIGACLESHSHRARVHGSEADLSAPTFSAIDVETANADPASICQIGIVHVRDGVIHDEWTTLLNPEAPFRDLNIAIHQITEEEVRHSPTLPDVHKELIQQLAGVILVSHTTFDRSALDGAMRKYGLTPLRVRWLDSAAVARRAWSLKRSSGGWSLAAIAQRLGVKFQHHVAVEDARVAAEIVLRACQETGRDLEEWL